MRSPARLPVLLLACALSASAQAQVAAVVVVPSYGPFAVVDERTPARIGGTDARSPAAFRTMMRAHPRVSMLLFIECPGTRDDASNLALGRMIRAAGLDAYVPPWASVRSGAVDLLVAAERREIADGARFVVHAWRYHDGREASDFVPSSPLHRQYLTYYRDMGMNAAQASAFYAMTNSVPYRSRRWLTAAEMRGWIGPGAGAPQIAYGTAF
jgi:hypothetical protein